FLLGTPTIVGEALKPIWDLATSMFAVTHKGKVAGAFGSYGWTGEGVPNITERLKQLKLKVQDGFRVRFRPTDADLLDAYDYGYDFGCIMAGKENDRKAKAQGGRKLVKCLVCGEIFDSSIAVCPVCGAGKEQLVEVAGSGSEFTSDKEQIITRIGGGQAACAAAEAASERA
ncbi:MAG: pyridine nucleotide-disulfide oxidoreductase, partial [Clostridia bacterium]|nr:pyridine nucleotide-disulfide oxidoreductase [Clostridia bacterium]